jgi:preprotein translocase subunit SecG
VLKTNACAVQGKATKTATKMGGGTKEKVAREAMKSKQASEGANLQKMMILLIFTLFAFSLRFGLMISLDLQDSLSENQAQFFAKIARDNVARTERWQKREAELLSVIKSDNELIQTTKDDDLPDWVTPRNLEDKVSVLRLDLDAEFKQA